MLIISLLDGHSEMAPPDPIPNSAVKRLSANGSAVRPCESRSPSSFLFYNEYTEDSFPTEIVISLKEVIYENIVCAIYRYFALCSIFI